MRLYHGALDRQFTQFRSDRPTFFFIRREEAEALIKNHDEAGNGRVLQVDYDGRVAPSGRALEVWCSVNGREPNYMYSMLCMTTNEYSDEQRQQFVEALRKAGYDAVAHSDYSQVDNQYDADAVCVLDASALEFVEL